MAQPYDRSPDKCTDAEYDAEYVKNRLRESAGALSSGAETLLQILAQDKYTTAVVLLCGAPPIASQTKADDLIAFGSYIHELAVWTGEARAAVLNLWGITEELYETSEIYRQAFDLCLEKWYKLRHSEGDQQ